MSSRLGCTPTRPEFHKVVTPFGETLHIIIPGAEEWEIIIDTATLFNKLEFVKKTAKPVDAFLSGRRYCG